MSVTILTPEKPSIPISVILLYICPGFRIIEKMPIAKQAHDGKIWAENNVTGKGATFILIYPLLCSTPNEQFLQPGETLSQPITLLFLCQWFCYRVDSVRYSEWNSICFMKE